MMTRIERPDRDDCALLASSFGDVPLAFAQECVRCPPTMTAASPRVRAR